ncbi:MAG TPA: GNAT family N-acetyltransferase [Rhabdochlamydiaceae bacterium]|nr:GNAT family N-acetyltransferase [Rhabdochlamydiaceae bacterium]
MYDGDMQTEADYLGGYSSSKNGILAVVKDGEKIVGAVSGKPLAETEEVLLVPFAQKKLPIQSVFYLGEIMLLKEYRGKGIGYQLYTRFEEAVKQKNQHIHMALVEIIRQDHDPRKPKNYISGHRFWQKLGFLEHSEMVIKVAYKEIDSTEKISHSLVYSLKNLGDTHEINHCNLSGRNHQKRS